MYYKERAALYLRKSRSDDPSESINETLAKHYNILTEYAVKHDITIIATYKEVVSGDGLFTRPQMLKLLADIEQDKYTAVLCVDIDRLGRSSTKDSGIIMETLQEHGCCIITPDKVYNLSDDVDEMTVEMKSFFARQELKSIKRRLHRGEVETLKAGGHTGEPPYGYKRIWYDKTPSLEPVPEEAETVKLIYDWYVNNGFGGTIISDKLNAMGIPAPDGGRFTRSSVMMILSNPIYTGKIVWNRKRRIKKKSPTDKHKEVDNPESEWLIAEGLHEAIIQEEQWTKAQEIRKIRAHPPTHTGVLKNPYAGLVYCENCGSAMQRQHSNTRYMSRLLCPITGCNGSIKADVFEKRLLSLITIELENLQLQRKEHRQPPPDTSERQMTLINKQIATIKAQRSRLHDLLEQGVYDIETFMMRQKELTDRLRTAEKELDTLRVNAQMKVINNDISVFIPTLERLIKNWDRLEPVDKNQILKKVIKRIEFKKDIRQYTKSPQFEMKIVWNF